MALPPVTEHTCDYGGQTTFYLACGPENGPLVIFVHGWPELAISWRNQLPIFGAMGFRAVAPDLRGYGNSTIYPEHEDYAQELIVADMIEFLNQIQADKWCLQNIEGFKNECNLS